MSDYDFDVTVFDAQGGGMGKAVIRALRQKNEALRILAVGTNAMATAAMIKAGANLGATGENAVVYNAANARVAIAPIGFLLADAMYGEISPKMADALGRSSARLILVPVRHCHAQIAGLPEMSLAQLLEVAAQAALEVANPPVCEP